MKKRYELFATVAEWTDSTTGKRCKRQAQIGTVFESPSGRLSMKLELLPIIPGWSGFVAFRDVAQPAATNAAATAEKQPAADNQNEAGPF
jgi:hypothetical protein